MEKGREWQRVKEKWKRAYQRYDRMMEKQGFYVVLAVCVLVIGLSAFYTFYLRGEAAEEPRRGSRSDRSRRPRDSRENRAPRAAAPAPEKKAETAEPLPAPEYPADYTPPVKNKPQSREWC